MAITPYIFDITDTLKNAVAEKRLEVEIGNEADITKKLVNISSDLGTKKIKISFSDYLSEEEQSLLLSVVKKHNGVHLKGMLPNLVRVLEEADDPQRRTGGHFRAKSYVHIAPKGQTVSYSEFVVPYPTSFLTMEYYSEPEQNGDTFTIDISPETTVGLIVEEAQIGDKVLTLNPEALEYIQLGDVAHLANNTHKEEVGYVIHKDIENSQVHVSGQVDESFTEFAPSVFQISKRFCDEIMYQSSSGNIQVGGSKIGGAYIPPNTVFRLKYTNNNPDVEKMFHALLEFLY